MLFTVLTVCKNADNNLYRRKQQTYYLDYHNLIFFPLAAPWVKILYHILKRKSKNVKIKIIKFV